ncbi:unnamed protein product [Prorocentrum cordatum]|uniref:Macro domain-containing protein n=1 Tax=Prorocentrum cordatum TaxID=2364126 RepID=A0ABN9WS19_9DINO|nr:unnamed protein product [Polarella glacialis]
MIQNFADYLGDYRGDVHWETLHDCLKTCDYRGMPEHVSLKMEPPGKYTMPAFVVKKSADSCLRTCHGTDLIWRYGNQYRSGRLAVQCMLEKLQGYQLRYRTVVPKPGEGPSRKTAEWELKAAGHKVIHATGPHANNANPFVEFAGRESARPESPVFGWEESRIERALNNYDRGRTNAKGLMIWVLTLRDFESWFLNNVIKRILASTLRSFGVAWIGKTRVGKRAGSKS